MTTAIYWFRNDLRLEDNPSFLSACEATDYLLPIFIHRPELGQLTAWGFPRIGEHRKVFLEQSLQELHGQLVDLGSGLYEAVGDALEVFENLKEQIEISAIYCEEIQAPEELEQVALIRSAGFKIVPMWQSSMLDPQSLPFPLDEMPDVFTQFRQQVEKKLKVCQSYQAA